LVGIWSISQSVLNALKDGRDSTMVETITSKT